MKWGSVDIKQLKAFQSKLQQLQAQQDAFCQAAAKELAARLLAKAIRRTPVGQYPEGSGMVGGTLRRGWTGNKSGGAAYAQNLPIQRVGNDYVIDIINPTEYASYVEYGHRTRGHKGWVPGKFMLTISVDEIQSAGPKILENKLAKWLGDSLK